MVDIIRTILETIGKHNTVPDQKFDPKELAMGIKIEREHTDDRQKAENVAKDHLSEFPDYYTRLKKMEKEGDKDKEKKNVDK